MNATRMVALLVSYDAQLTPVVGNCGEDRLDSGLEVGDLYDGLSGGSLAEAHDTYGARTLNLSWSSGFSSYFGAVVDVDDFLDDHREAMVFVAAGDFARYVVNDGIPLPGSVGAPANAKNAISVGASYVANDWSPDPGFDAQRRDPASSVGNPAFHFGSQRLNLLLMAPGTDDPAGMGLDSGFSCRSQADD